MEKTRVLIVEDDADDLLLLMHLLERASFGENVKVIGHRVRATEYLNDVKEHAEDLTAVFIDMHFPSMGGVHVLRAIRKSARLSHLRVIMMTTSTSPSDLELCSRLGVFGYVQKPITQEIFISSIAKIFHSGDTTRLPDGYFPR